MLAAMKPDSIHLERLRESLILAAMGALPALGCSDPQTPSAGTPTSPPSDTAAAIDTGARPVMSIPTAPSAAPVVASSAAAPPVEIPRTPPENCFSPFSSARSIGTGGPAPKPPDQAYDKHGCLPFNQVSNGCCVGATAGPRFEDGFCCYTIPTGPCCGRPFMVGGVARVAPTHGSAAWIGRPLAPGPIDLAASEQWLRDARMEHASVASFARFVLDLLSLGAPAALVRDAQIALGDEIAHARLCFELASRFAGEALAPGPLGIAAASPSTRGIEEIVRDAVVEGCVGETVAARVANERLARSTDPELSAALERIACDEARHAELAWRFIAWVVEKEPRATAWVDEALAQAGDAASLQA